MRNVWAKMVPNELTEENLGVFSIYKIVTIMFCRSETAVWLPLMNTGTKFSAASANPLLFKQETFW